MSLPIAHVYHQHAAFHFKLLDLLFVCGITVSVYWLFACWWMKMFKS